MRIYTRTGDAGETSLFSGERVPKSAQRVEAYGTLDELNSVVGMAHAGCRNERVKTILASLQGHLLQAGADLATSFGSKRRPKRIEEADWKAVEDSIDELEAELPVLRNFILPTGTAGAATLHLARSVCRRVERLVVGLMETEEVNTHLLIFLNRLSDYFFVLARYENFKSGQSESIWKG